MFSKPENKRSVVYDLMNIEIGESIISRIDSTCYYCVKKTVDEWTVYRHDLGEVIDLGSYCEISNYIYPYNEVFDKEKTLWVEQYFKDTIESQRQIFRFNCNIERNFM